MVLPMSANLAPHPPIGCRRVEASAKGTLGTRRMVEHSRGPRILAQVMPLCFAPTNCPAHGAHMCHDSWWGSLKS